MKSKIACALMVGLMLQACSSRPRQFTPTLAARPTNLSEFDAAYATCQQLLVAGKLDSSGRSGSAAAGAAAAAGTVAVGGTTAAAVGGYAGLAAASATIVLLPFAILGGAWGMSKLKRAKKERAIKTSLEGCLQERGYAVAGWSKTAKKPIIVAEVPAE
jgi:trehalose/maltose hydrolase-like predicted phosphorylase